MSTSAGQIDGAKSAQRAAPFALRQLRAICVDEGREASDEVMLVAIEDRPAEALAQRTQGGEWIVREGSEELTVVVQSHVIFERGEQRVARAP